MNDTSKSGMGTAKKVVFGLLVVALVLAFVYVVVGDRERGAGASDPQNAGGGTLVVRGTVVENDQSMIPVDGPGFLLVGLSDGRLAKVTYICGMMPVANAAATRAGAEAKAGDVIEAFGALDANSDASITTCADEKYYIRTIGEAPAAGGPGSARVTPEYYANLRAQCADSADGASASCCEASVDAMRDGGYTRAGFGVSCPDGYESGMLKCVGSMEWCEPVVVEE